jgi:ribosomal protein L10
MLCSKGVQFKVVKNTLLKKGFRSKRSRILKNLSELLSGPTSLMYGSDAKSPAVILKEFRSQMKDLY